VCTLPFWGDTHNSKSVNHDSNPFRQVRQKSQLIRDVFARTFVQYNGKNCKRGDAGIARCELRGAALGCISGDGRMLHRILRCFQNKNARISAQNGKSGEGIFPIGNCTN
jgi:hypothetical protein